MAFATVDDLAARMGRELTEAEEAQASVLLDDAAAMLMALVSIDPDNEVQAANLKRVSCAMVQRAMMSGAGGGYGVTEATATMGPFTQRVNYANPSGDLYVTKAERASLGIGIATIGAIRAKAGQVVIHHGHC